jgi:general stress protein 26
MDYYVPSPLSVEGPVMDEEVGVDHALALVDRSSVALLGTIDEGGYPNIRALMKMENEGLKRVWFSTNTSSQKVAHVRGTPKACVYFLDASEWRGLMLTGTVDVLRDQGSRERLWRQGFERYYPLGVDDPDYSVLRFTAERGRYYHRLDQSTFDL